MYSGQEMNVAGPENLFNLLPDDVLLSIFNRLQDAGSLCVSMSVCKRFCSLALQVDELFLQIPRKKVAAKSDKRRQWSKNLFKNKFIKALINPPLRFFSAGLMKFKSKKDECACECHSYHAPNEILNPFQELRSLQVRIPCYGKERLDAGTGKNDDRFTTFLKWEAEFGRQLKSCVILGGKFRSEVCENGEDSDESGVVPEEEAKLMTVCTISCLIAASARHELIQQIVKNKKLVDNVSVTDELGQGRVRMNKEQIEQLRDMTGPTDERKFDSLRMMMWYAKKLELPSLGKVVEGATVVLIRPSGAAIGGEEKIVAEAFGGEAEEQVIAEAVRRVMASKRRYTLELSSS